MVQAAINTFVEGRLEGRSCPAFSRKSIFIFPAGKSARPHFYHCAAVYRQGPATRYFLGVLRGTVGKYSHTGIYGREAGNAARSIRTRVCAMSRVDGIFFRGRRCQYIYIKFALHVWCAIRGFYTSLLWRTFIVAEWLNFKHALQSIFLFIFSCVTYNVTNLLFRASIYICIFLDRQRSSTRANYAKKVFLIKTENDTSAY